VQIFLSWAGSKSHDVAQAFKEWLPTVLFAAKPWISSADIDKGGTWLTSIKEALAQSAGIGLFFVTREALASHWLLFEAGSVASLGHQRVCVVYVDIETSEIPPPLSLFQATKLVKEDVEKLVMSLNGSLTEPMDVRVLHTTFERGWPDLEAKLTALLAVPDRARRQKKPSQDQVLADIAETTQRIEARLSNLEREARRPREFIGMQAITSGERDLQRRMTVRMNKFFQMPPERVQDLFARQTPSERERFCEDLGISSLDDFWRRYAKYKALVAARTAASDHDRETSSPSGATE